MIVIYVYQLIVLQAKRSLLKSSFVCLFVNFGGLPYQYLCWAFQIMVVRTIASLPKSSFVCFLSIFEGSMLRLTTYGGADDSLSVKVFVDLFCSPQAAHRADKTKPRTFSF